MEGPLIDMARVVDLAIKGLPPGTSCYVTMSGGNCATIYVGEPYGPDKEYVIVLGGPGNFQPLPPTAHPGEFSVGFDHDFAGKELRWFTRPHPTLTREERAAFAIVELYRNHPNIKPVLRRGIWVDPLTQRVLTAEQCEQLGIDPDRLTDWRIT